MSLRERLRRALHEFTRPDEAASQVSPRQEMTPGPDVIPGPDLTWVLNRSRVPIDTGPWQCCYCGNHLYTPFAPDTPLVLHNSIIHQQNGHTSCGHCWLNQEVQWPCDRYHPLPGRTGKSA